MSELARVNELKQKDFSAGFQKVRGVSLIMRRGTPSQHGFYALIFIVFLLWMNSASWVKNMLLKKSVLELFTILLLYVGSERNAGK